MSQSGNRLAGSFFDYRYGFVYWSDCNGDEIPQYEELGELYYDAPFARLDPTTNLQRAAFSDDYNTPVLDELTVSFEKALTDDLAVSLTGFYKKKGNLAFIPDSRGETDNVFKGIMPDGSIETKDNWHYVGTTIVGGQEVPTYEQIVTPVGTYFYNLKDSYNQYLGLQFVMTKKTLQQVDGQFLLHLAGLEAQVG
jgi:hypothetical protein